MHVAIIGKHFSGLRDYLQSKNINFTVFKDSRNIPKQPQPDTYYVDFSDPQAVIDMVAEQHNNSSFSCVLTLFEQYIVLTARIADALNLPGLPVESAIACTDKSVMRAHFAKAPKKISPDFKRVNSWSDIESFVATHSFPLMLKPANLAKSLLVTKNHDIKELKQNYEKIQEVAEAVYDKYAPHNERIVLIEEFLEGSIHSVDAFVDDTGAPTVLPYIVDYQTGYDIGFDDNFHYSRIVPTSLSPEAQADFLETAEIAIRSLGMRNSAAHVEIIVTKEGARIVEIGARNGGYRERLHGLAHGIDIYGNLLRTMSAQPLDVIAKKEDPCAVLELFPKQAGVFQEISGLDTLRGLSSLKYLAVKRKPGDIVGKSSDGHKTSCVIVLHSSDTSQFNKDLDFVNHYVSVVTSRT